MCKVIAFVIAVLFVIGCNDDQNVNKDSLDDLEIDLDQDGIIDFKIIYQQLEVVAPVDPDPGAYELIRGILLSENNNQILKSEEASSILFLNDSNLVTTNINPPLFWEGISNENSSIIVTISQDIFDKTWPNEWRVSNEEIKESYLVGFKLSSSVNNLGFFELSIDNQTGLIEILNIEFI